MENVFSKRTGALKISLVAILSAFVVEFVFGVLSNSLALLTDSIHALLDSVVTLVLLLAARFAMKPPDAEHTYGHGKVESLGGLIGGIAIFLIACFFIFEAVTKIQSPPHLMVTGPLALAGAAYTICVDIFRIILLRRAISKIGGTTLRADFYHAFLDLGSTLVVIAGIALITFGFEHGDFFAAIVLGVLLCVLSVKLVYRTAQELTDVISPELVNKVQNIALSTEGVVETGSVLMRRSGDSIFADVTISLRADVSFDKAHEISSQVEKNIKDHIANSEITVHFEPSWKDVPRDSKIYDIAFGVSGVKGIHNVSHHTSNDMTFVSLHAMVDRQMSLEDAHHISEIIEERIRNALPDIQHITIHLEPHIAIPKDLKLQGTNDEKIIQLLKGHAEVKKIGTIVTLNFDELVKIDIDCSFDKNLSIEQVHDLTSQIEQNIRNHFKNSVITIHPEPY
ncbi:MAG: cation diffusion facilitator family transporter [Candidatus Nitrosotenuis sp.]